MGDEKVNGRPRYVVITLDDAKRINRWLRGASLAKEPVIGPLCDAWKSGPLWCSLGAHGPEVPHVFDETPASIVCASAIRLSERFDAETGGDLGEVVELLKGLPICAACDLEGQASSCQSVAAHKLGRRLRRLVERANETGADRVQ